jgi:hypothetical protein
LTRHYLNAAFVYTCNEREQYANIWRSDTQSFRGTGVVYSQAPVGSIVAFAGDVTKNVIESSGWMLCDGRMLNAAQYPLLFAVIGYRYGGSDGQFRIPRLDTTTLSVISDLPEASAPGTRPANAVISQLIRFV